MTKTAEIIESIKTHLQDAYTSIDALDGVVPTNKNLESLAASITSLSENTTTMGPWGRIIYIQNSRAYHIALQNEEEFNALCTSGNLNSTITIQGRTLQKFKVVSFTWGQNFPTTVPDYFLYSFTGVGMIAPCTPPSGIVHIGNHFMEDCRTYSYSMKLPSSIESIGTHFRNGNYALNTPTDISETKITQIPDYYMTNCRQMNGSIIIPEGVISIGKAFLANCWNFSGQITFPSTLKTIGGNFLAFCSTFNRDIEITSGITNIGNSFLKHCPSFASSITITGDGGEIGNDFANGIRTISNSTTPKSIVLNGTWKGIGNSFLANSSFLACPIEIAGDNLAVGNFFLAYNTNFNHSVTFSGTVSSIGNGFMREVSHCTVAPTGLDNVTQVGDYFCYRTPIGTISLPNMQTAGDWFMAYSGMSGDGGSYLAIFDELRTIGSHAFYGKVGGQFAPKLSKITKVGSNFCNYCSFMTIAAGSGKMYPTLTEIGEWFMTRCYALQTPQPLELPSSLTTAIPEGFLYNCPAITQVYIPANVTFVGNDNYSLSVYNRATCISVVQGITLSGPGAATTKTVLPNMTSGYYRRNLI